MENQVEKKEKKVEKKAEQVKRLTIGERLASVATEVTYVQKEDKVDGMNYRFTSHDAVTSSLQKSLFSNGLFMVPTQAYDAVNKMLMITIKFCCVDIPSEFVESNVFIPVTPGKFGATAKEFGSAYSYGVKYILLKTFMLQTGEEDAEVILHREEERLKKEEEKAKREPKNTTSAPKEKRISNDQVIEITKILDGDELLEEKICGKCSVSSVYDIPASYYGRVMTYLNALVDIKKGSLNSL